MTTIKIEPISITTKGGHKAEITGINPASTDFIVGSVGQDRMAMWDKGGRCRDNHEDCNLDMRNNELQELLETAKAIVPQNNFNA